MKGILAVAVEVIESSVAIPSASKPCINCRDHFKTPKKNKNPQLKDGTVIKKIYAQSDCS